MLDFDFAAAACQAGQPLLVVGNLPYYITSPILLRLAQQAAHTLPDPAVPACQTGVLEAAVLMVQREVADRVTAAPGSRDYGLLTVLCALEGPATRLFTLPPEAFSPAPEVHSTVFRWSFTPRFPDLSRESFQQTLKAAFAQKRKTLANNLRAAGFPASRIQSAMQTADVPAQARAEELPLEAFAALHQQLTAPIA